MTLNELKKNQNAKVIGFNSDDLLKRRFISYGIFKGTLITLDRISPMGDPKIYLIMDYQLIIRNNDAENILIEIVQ